VEDNVTGFLIKPFDINEVSEKIIQLSGDPDLRMRMGIAGRKKAEKQFQFSQSLDALKSII
jgi:glycosyltransferase involved in cell wall biosynthesis